MNVAPLQLKTYFVTEIELKTIPSYNPKRKQSYKFKNFQHDVKFLVNDQVPGIWQVPLTLKYLADKNDNTPYEFNLMIVGFFEVVKDYPKEKAESLVHINAPALLYSAAREIIATITGRCPWGTILLPTVNFLPGKPKTSKRTRKQKKK